MLARNTALFAKAWHRLAARRHGAFAHCLLIAAAGLLAYVNSVGVPFYFDDYPCIVDNPVVHDLKNLARLGDYWQIGLTEDIRNNIVTRIVTYLTFAANYQLHGPVPGGFRLVNLLIHLANALLVYGLVRELRIFADTSTRPQKQQTDRLALVTALIFVVHPLQTNTVTYIVQRFAALATTFMLIALVAYLAGARSATSPRGRQLYGVALAATLLAMFTKEIAFTLPVLISLCDLAFHDGSWRQRLRRLAPFLATMLLLPLAVMTLAAHSEITGGSATKALDLVNIGQGSRWDYFFTQWRVIVTYLRLLLVPVGLHLEYDYPAATSPWDPEILASGLLLATLLGTGCWLLFRKRAATLPGSRLIGFGICWFFLALSMESSIIRLDDLLFEYRLYLPSIGFFLAAVSGADLLRQKLARRWPGTHRGAWLVVAALVVSLTGATLQRNRIWQNELLFWQDNVEKSPNRARSRSILATVLLKQGEPGKAMAELETAIQLNPSYWPAHESLGDIRWNLGLYRLAASAYAEAHRHGNRTRNLRLKLGRAQRWSGNHRAARETFVSLLTTAPDDPEIHAELRAILH